MILHLPLWLRVPNPPSPFLSRERELDALDALDDERAALVWLYGEPGVGKKALLSYWYVRRADPARLGNTLWIALTPSAPIEALIAAIVRALGTIEERAHALVAEQAHQMLAEAIDLADRHQLEIVLDLSDTSSTAYASPEALHTLARQLQQYTRRARWWLITPHAPPPEQTHALHLQALPPAALRELVSHWMARPQIDALLERGEREQVLQSVLHHTGNASLLTLEQRLFSLTHPEPLSPTQLDALPLATRQAATLLALSPHPLPTSWLEAGFALHAARLAELERQALLRHTPSGWRLTPATHQALAAAPQMGSRDELEAIARRLASVDDLRARLEALRLAMEHRLYPLIDALFEAHFEAWRRAGFLADLYGLLAGADDPKLTRWRFRCSCYMARFQESERLQEELGALSLEDRMYLAYMLLMQGRFEEVIALEQSARQEHPHPDATARDHLEQLALTAARALIQRGRHAEALTLLATASFEHAPWLRMRALHVQINAMTHLGEFASARRLLERARAVFDTLSYMNQRQWSTFFIHSAYRLKQFGAASQLANRFLDELGTTGAPRAAEWVLYAAVWLETGELGHTTRAIHHAREHFEKRAPGMMSMLLNIELAQASLCEDRAMCDALERAFAALDASQIPADSQADHLILRARIAIRWHHEREAILEQLARFELDAASEHTRPLLTTLQAHLEALSTAHATPSLPALHADAHLEARVEHTLLALHLDILCALSTHDLERDTAALLDEVERLGARRLEAELRLGALWHAFAFDQPLAPHQRAITRLLPELPELHHHHLALLALLTRPERPWLELSRLSLTLDPDTLPHRLCQLLLGAPLQPDALEEALMTRAMARWGDPEPLWMSAPTHGPLLELDPLAQRLSRVASHEPRDTVSVALSSEELHFKLLKFLAIHGGEADKEALVLGLWPELGTYHPLHHDNRLRLAVTKLRRLLRDHFGEEELLLTTSRGYALGASVRTLAPQEDHP